MPAGGKQRFRQFTHRVHIMPDDVLCPWSGLGDMAGPMSWLMPSSLGVDKPGTWMQELLHNFGMHHGGRDSVDNENLYVSLRVRAGGDATLDAEYVYKLSVHEALASVDNAAPSPEFNPHFLLMHLIDQGQTLLLPQYGLLIQARELVDNGMRMVVDICRYRFDPSVECRLLPPIPTVTGTRTAAPPTAALTSSAPAPGSPAPVAQAPKPCSVLAASQPQAPFNPTKAPEPCAAPSASRPQAPFAPTTAPEPHPTPAASQPQAPVAPTTAHEPHPTASASRPKAPFTPAQAPKPHPTPAASRPQAPFAPTTAHEPCPTPAASRPQTPFAPTKAPEPCPAPSASRPQAPFAPTKAPEPCPAPSASQPQAPVAPTEAPKTSATVTAAALPPPANSAIAEPVSVGRNNGGDIGHVASIAVAAAVCNYDSQCKGPAWLLCLEAVLREDLAEGTRGRRELRVADGGPGACCDLPVVI
ncbi:hypothetical protein HYH03_015511 [Edaphochlamys debaryana]|uniref:Peptidase M11 gametolysin domain-containing protein n=1 Tax=Edaphochlamys debaryana TaxID=47281 RepID=A0A836BR49_9CHLO|nr:hypothetical protein HYH03_015511 [Edaphochlamys debaryana]|eukprot:KAG2485800.1 hypothetical protein HYH03_015511 [Edaphochlamys debaryana]